jgi:hypothetical protein
MIGKNIIIFNGMKGIRIYEKNKCAHIALRKIDFTKYDYAYSLDDGFAGSYVFIKNNNYRFIKCGSGIPIINDKSGTFSIAAQK